MIGQRPTLAGPLHALQHIVLVVIGWCIFCGFWWVILFRQTYDIGNLVLLVVGTVIAAPLVTLYWVMHNRGIYERKGPRRKPQSISEHYDHDWAGRLVIADFDHLRQSRLIFIRSTADEKRYLDTIAADPLRSAA